MRTRLRHIWEVLTTGYWFVPATMTAGAVALAFLMLYVDGHASRYLPEVSTYSGGSDGASTLLSSVAGSVITVAGVAFSITIAALSQASSQFGPRLLRNFLRDTGNQVVLGTFVATFVYCLLILRAIDGKTDFGGEFVPSASVSVAVLLAAASIAVLIYFIHHVSISLQAPAVIAGVAAELDRLITHIGSGEPGNATSIFDAKECPFLPPRFDDEARPVRCSSAGYVQAVSFESLLEIARGNNLVLSLAHRAGDHVIQGSLLLRAWPPARCGPRIEQQLNEGFIFGSQPTPEQDIEYAVRQLVEIAVRALSPGVNDPFTALNCIDTLGVAIVRVADIGIPGPLWFDRDGALRVIAPVTTFAGLADAAFNQIRQYGRKSVSVNIRLLEVLGAAGALLQDEDQRQVLLRQARAVYAGSDTASARDQDDIRDRWRAVCQALAAR